MTARPGLAAGEAIAELLAGFIQELRQAGLPVSLTENLDAMEAVKHIPLEDREAFKYALAATLVKNNAHWRAFETVFEVYFSLRGRSSAPATGTSDAISKLIDELQQQSRCRATARERVAGVASMTPEEIAEMLYKALQRGDDASCAAWPARSFVLPRAWSPAGRSAATTTSTERCGTSISTAPRQAHAARP